MAITVDAIFRLAVTYVYLGQNMENIFWFRTRPGALPYVDLWDMLNFLANDTYDHIIQPSLDIMSDQVSLVGSTMQYLTPEPGQFVPKFWVGQNGHALSGGHPSFVACVISEHTRYSGRRTHGRHYLGGVANTMTTGNQLNSFGQTTAQHICDEWHNRYSEDGSSNAVNLVVYSKKNGVTHSDIPPFSAHYAPEAGIPITTWTPRLRLYTQRHRLEGRGI